MDASVKKMGKSLAIELPEEEVKRLGLKAGMKVEVEIKKKSSSAAPDDGWGD
ncbi:MAG: AbrB/MazE/SpoVT family DNA-binding domain-containing protein [Candidatus Micrarchaeota archaeon]